MQPALIAYGSNLGDSRGMYKLVEQELKSLGRLVATSSPYSTAPVVGLELGSASESHAADDNATYVNGAFLLESDSSPLRLMQQLLALEKRLGRKRTRRWAARAVDLDLLIYGDTQIDGTDVTCPHPRMSFRRFVLEPAAEIAPDLLHPGCGLTVGQLLARLNERPNVVAWIDGLDEVEIDAVEGLITPNRCEIEIVDAEGLPASRTLASRVDAVSAKAWLVRIENAPQFEKVAPMAKLVAFPASILTLEKSGGLSELAKSYRGARLLLKPDNRSAISELVAAVDAMI